MKNNDGNSEFITVGKVGSPYGIHGWLKIHAYTEYAANILKYKPWYLKNPTTQDLQKVIVAEGRLQHQHVIVKFQGVDNPETARLFAGRTILITRSELPDLQPNEYYWADLKGLTVINKNGEILGKVIYLLSTGSNDVLVVKGAKEHAIPFILGSVIQKVDLAKKEIHVDWEVI